MKRVTELLESWRRSDGERRIPTGVHVHLTRQDAAKIAALHDMFPGCSKEQIISDVISAALDELEASFPYVKGDKVIEEDDQGDPIFEDVGETPRFKQLAHKHYKRLADEANET